ncbi:MAG: hypothetical protein RL748_2124 [Pseudomonadota bacterium]|jgi:hypothetical protein
MKNTLVLRFCLGTGLLLSMIPAYAANWTIQVEADQRLSTRHYLLRQGDCKILWRLTFFQAGKGLGIREEIGCALPVAEQIPLRRALLQKVAGDTNQMQGMRNFVWGSVPNKDIFMPRLAQALRASERWDAGKGDWRGNEGAYAMRDLMNRQNIFAEVVASFASEGWKLVVVDVEKIQIGDGVLVTEAGKYPVDCGIFFCETDSAALTMQSLPQLFHFGQKKSYLLSHFANHLYYNLASSTRQLHRQARSKGGVVLISRFEHPCPKTECP